MSRFRLPIKDPCHENWDAMNREGDARRFCESCVKQVHDLSAMTEHQARSVLDVESAKGRVCVRYTADEAGNVNFLPEMAPAPSIWRMTLAAAGMTLALLTGCTDTEPDEIREDRCVYEVGPWAFTAARGEGNCPSVEAPPHEMVGEAPYEMVGMASIEPEPCDPEPAPILEVKGDIGPEPEPVLVRPEPVRMGKIAIDHGPPSEPPIEPDPPPVPEFLGEAPIDPEPPKPVTHEPVPEFMGDVAYSPDPPTP
ncbi:hypothetical protein DB30_06367 [Enhygromyxa salina]|uniref:Uncharacterized protein n=1 Tax=Enhygromyxa salina TaxID=215803 RepID=A0A0C2CUI4_9BACT|nr:hypothetical protein [Enhygromyxa salina]KIG14781.1 hypothetical protein DB30_06367 [Enhygromyxa salina]